MNTAMNTGQSGQTGGQSDYGYSRQGYYQTQKGSICSDAASRTMLALAGGAAVGALMMYLLDPEEGAQRRRYTGQLASGALSGTASALGSAWDYTKDMASHVGQATAAGAGAFRQTLSDTGQQISDTVGHSRFGRSASRFGGQASDRFGYLMHGNRSTGFIDGGFGQTLSAIGFLTLGVAAMYYYDPKDGARRRSTCRDQFLSGFNRMARSIDRLGRHLYNRATGMAHEARSKMSREDVDDRVIIDRVRSGIGRCVSNTGAVQVQSRNGRVVLNGYVLASEADALLKCAWAVRGVKEIINQLQIRPNDGAGTSSASSPSIASTRPSGLTSGMGAAEAGACPPGAAL